MKDPLALAGSGSKLGARGRARTYDPLIKSQLLYQLSYARQPGNGSGGWIRTSDTTGMNRML